ncbi:MAG: DDE-type integrase/transposase/recombinase [Acidimicrobiia bacterium]
MIGPIRGTRVSPEIKLRIIGAVAEAKRGGLCAHRTCEVIMLSPRRLRRWCAGRPPEELAEADVADRPPVARVRPHAITPAERAAIVSAATEDDKVHLRHRKLTHTLSREGRVFCSESTTLRVLRAEALVPAYRRTPRPKREKPEVRASEPNQSWRYDFTGVPTADRTWFLLPLLDACSAKIVGWSFEPRQSAAMLERCWGKALAAEGVLHLPPGRLPDAVSDRGAEMRARTFREFLTDLGIAQVLSRPRTPADNAGSEAFNATLKCERLYRLDTSTMSPAQVEAEIAAFIHSYNEVRLHQGIGFVTPAERHDGRHVEIIEARRRGMAAARGARLRENRQGSGSTPDVKTALRGSERAVSKRGRPKKGIGPCS